MIRELITVAVVLAAWASARRFEPEVRGHAYPFPPPRPAVAMLAAALGNWLVMGAPLNAAMLLGDEAILSAAKRRAHAEAAVSALLRSIGAAVAA